MPMDEMEHDSLSTLPPLNTLRVFLRTNTRLSKEKVEVLFLEGLAVIPSKFKE